jgi:hypothetical protein
MKIKLVLASLAVAGLAASSAVAAPPEGKGKPRTGEGCKPKITVVVRGTLASAPANPLSITVTGGNRWGRLYSPTASVTLDTAKTKVRGGGMKTVDDLLGKLKQGDRVLVQARVCKDDFLNNGKPTLTATKVIGHPANAGKDEQDND